MTNLLSEVGVKSTSFDKLVEDAKMQWRETLSRVKISALRHEAMGYSRLEADSIHRIFYSSMYRASLFPRQLIEYDQGTFTLSIV
jgi:putative alpha-1,2-mannosidase